MAHGLARPSAGVAALVLCAAALYVGAMVAERLDHPIAAMLRGRVSGHTLKHLLAAAAIYVVYRMLLRRQRVPTA